VNVSSSSTQTKLLDPLEAHRLWAPIYDDCPNPLLALEERTIARRLPNLAGRLVVDVAAGTGRWARYAQLRGARTLALDRCPEMLARSPQPAAIADATRLPVRDGIADVTFCAFAFSYVPWCLDELARITKPRGLVVVSDMHPKAVLSGWTRSFRREDQVISIRHRFISLEELAAPGLLLKEMNEPTLGPQEEALFTAAGRSDLYAKASGIPAVFAAIFKRV
jgi:ubiquinone/menaquinone biosynthesis C-methylase UbiE